jgi:hypothetical protein
VTEKELQEHCEREGVPYVFVSVPIGQERDGTALKAERLRCLDMTRLPGELKSYFDETGTYVLPGEVQNGE